MIRDKIYFASDFHLGAPSLNESLLREKRIVAWLNKIQCDAKALYLVGDLFDFWYEYKTVVPKGYIRFLGKLAELKDNGVEIIVFTGNHDMWMFGYLSDELNIPVYKHPIVIEHAGKQFFVGHGDGLGPGDYGYKTIKKIFSNKLCIKLFGLLHPDVGIKIANFWSRRSRQHTGTTEDTYLGDNHEWLVQYCLEQQTINPKIDYFIFGHRHLPIYKIIGKSLYVNLGDWIKYNTYAVFDGNNLQLKEFKEF